MNIREQMTRAYELNMSLERGTRWWPESVSVVGTNAPKFLVCGEVNRYVEAVDNESAAWTLVMYCAWNWIRSQIGGEATPIDTKNAECGAFWSNPIETLTIHTRKVVGS